MVLPVPLFPFYLPHRNWLLSSRNKATVANFCFSTLPAQALNAIPSPFQGLRPPCHMLFEAHNLLCSRGNKSEPLAWFPEASRLRAVIVVSFVAVQASLFYVGFLFSFWNSTSTMQKASMTALWVLRGKVYNYFTQRRLRLYSAVGWWPKSSALFAHYFCCCCCCYFAFCSIAGWDNWQTMIVRLCRACRCP